MLLKLCSLQTRLRFRAERVRVVVFLALGIAMSASGAGWVERSSVTHPAGNLTFAVRWEPSEGLRLRIAPPRSPATVTIDLDRQSPQVRCTPGDAFSEEFIEGAQFNTEALPTRRLEAVEVVVKFRQETWSIYVGNRPIAVMPAPFLPPAVVSHPAAALPVEARRAVQFQKTDDFVFHDDFLVPEGQEDELAAWERLSGIWTLHSVVDEYRPALRATALARAKSSHKSMASMSPNFYSLVGSGTNAVLTTGYDFYDAYSVEAAHQVGPGEGGIVFDYVEGGGYHAFTVQPDGASDTVRLSLWRTASSNAATRTELAAATSEILDGQWVMLKVRTFQNRIQCFVDKTKVIDIPAELPAGGRFGIFANTDDKLLFDDVTARSNHDLDFLGINDIRRHALVENGSFFPRRRFFSLFPARETPFLEPPESGDPQWLIMGAQAHGAHVFAADFQPASGTFDIGLIAGYAGAAKPYYRMTCRRDGANEAFRLESVGVSGEATVLQSLTLPVRAGTDGAAPVHLMCDATADCELRFYRNHELVLVHHAATSVGGASGLYVGPGSRVRIGNPEYSFERSDLYTDQFEKTTAYVEDRFMRHWSSPEGQWEDPTNNVTWYKGDVFGRVAVHLPLIDQTTVDLGVAEGSSNGAWVVSVTNGSLWLQAGIDAAVSNAPASVSTNLVTGLVGPETNRVAGYAIHTEGYWIWLTSGDRLLLQQPLAAPLQGRHIRITGFTTEHLAASRVERYNVKDFLFKESLHEWMLNGGRWEVINRFQCDPRWSHMDGESTNGLAAMWSKYVFRGDFCVEMYAGTRHLWYERCGDYNLTVLNRDTTPSQGYTVTCTGWDYDLSQLYTTLYRNGKVMAQSDVYCAPRYREGNKRRERSALVAEGRDVHGAWYYIKFRRSGNRLEYYFDNELVFAANDPDPLAEGSLGVWTFMNSMVVARVKIAAESVAPRPLAFMPVAAAGSLAAAVPVPAEPAPTSAVAVAEAGGHATAGARAEEWESDDPVSRARLTWHTPVMGSPYFTVTSVLGSGTLLARRESPAVPYPQLAGWRFDVKRTPRGQFNLYYSVGRNNAQGIYVPEQFFFHRLSGEDFAKGTYVKTGATEVPGPVVTNSDWHAAGEWTHVEALLPTEGFRLTAGDTGLLVRVEGFGNLQPGYAMQGLTGNGPGEGYAVRSFTAIPYVRRPAPAMTCAWSAARPDTVEIRANTDALNRAVAFANVAIGGVPVQATFTPPTLLEAAVPRTNECAAGAATNLAVTVSGDGFTNTFALLWSDARLRSPPVLMALEGFTPFFQNFESRNMPALEAGRMRLETDDPVQGSFLNVFNRMRGQRLSSEFGLGASLARYPVLSFRYRGGVMARVSLSMPGAGSVRLSEALTSARVVRGSGDLVLDDRWRTWQGRIGDALSEQSFSAGAMTVSRLRLASLENVDQTGKYTEFGLDDLVIGPAATNGNQLAFTPHYFDFEGVTQVQMSVRSGAEDYPLLDATRRAALVWKDIPNHRQAVPDIRALGNGLGHVLLKARGVRGTESQVTDLPFLLHRAAPAATCAFEPATNAMSNGSSLVLTVATADGPPLDVEALRFRWNDQEVPVVNAMGSRFMPGTEWQKVMLNWPLVFRQQLDRTGPGEAFKLVVTGIRDGAGNAAPDIEMPRRIDYAADHTPPTLLPTTYPTNVFWTTAWEANTEMRPFFTALGGSTAALVRRPELAPWLAVQTSTRTGGVTYAFTPRWKVQAHPCLAFRMRRPAPSTNAAARIDVALELDPTNTLVVALAGPSGGGTNRVSLPRPVVWRTNEWESFTLDVPSLLKQKGLAQKPVKVKSLSFVTTALSTNDVLHLQSVFVFAPWGPRDRVKMSAYDESGIGDIRWEAAQQADGTDIAPATPTGEGWMTMRLSDKAGNLATPVHLPMYGRPVAEMTEP